MRDCADNNLDDPANAVLLVDDNPRFSFSVWRAFSRMAEFGYAERKPFYARFEAPRGFEAHHPTSVSPDRVFALEWIDSMVDGSTSPLSWFKERIDYWTQRGVTVWAIVDVRHRSSVALQEFRDCFETSTNSDERFFVMTSYRNRDGKEDVKYKDLGSLIALRRKLYGPEDEASTVIDQHRGAIQVLITGAGFELREHETAIGVPPTAQLLAETRILETNDRWRYVAHDERIRGWDEIKTEANGMGFPVPHIRLLGGRLLDELREAAEIRNLDLYWDLLLRAAHHRHEVDVRASLKEREDYKARAASIELRMRDGFRRSIVKYDIGHMTQSMAAAALRWNIWLTTNYTRFIDRAIDAVCDDRSVWRLLQTPIEADVFLNEQLARGADRTHQQLAIKLHGDIGQVYTMALAGHDKEALSPLFVRPSLSVMYGAATEALCECLTRGASDETPSPTESPIECWWHIVGHGLCDRPLLALIRTVTARTTAIHRFRVVAPDPAPAIARLLAACPKANGHIESLKMTAQQYLLQTRDRSVPVNSPSSIPPAITGVRSGGGGDVIRA